MTSDTDPRHRSKYSHPDEHGSKPMGSSRDDRTPCRYGSACYDIDPRHRSKYSHPKK